MPRDIAPEIRSLIDLNMYAPEEATVARLRQTAALPPEARAQIGQRAAQLVRDIRSSTKPGLMEVFLAEYGLSTDEGIALMCLAEALLRVPDAETIDALIEDKIAPSDWGRHMGRSSSPLVNASTWALMLTGRVLDPTARPGPAGHLRAAVKRMGEPVIRTAVGRAMKEMGSQFVLGETIQKAMKRGEAMEAKGYTYSYDMLGEAARTEGDALRYLEAYSKAIDAIAKAAKHSDIGANPGISVKLSALFPRYEEGQVKQVMATLVPRLLQLCEQAKAAGIGLNIDAEEADRLSISLDVIGAAFASPTLAGWDGFGVVVQAYGLRASETIDWLHALAQAYDRRIMVRLVKGAYWDTEIKRAQVEGIDSFPVFTSKTHTDISYIANARKLLGMTARIYPQFATHNAHTVAAVLHMAKEGGVANSAFEFQRLHGMGETLHALVKNTGTRCRIYAPVGAHADLLAYLVRRLLENGANSSFVNQIVDEEVPPETVAADPFDASDRRPLARASELFLPERANSQGFDLTHRPTLAQIDEARAPFRAHLWQAAPLVCVDAPVGAVADVPNPANPADKVGEITWASAETVCAAAAAAHPWAAAPQERARILNAAADLFEAHFGEIFALLHREAGKTLRDGVAELREAVDFLRYYAARALDKPDAPRGVFACISPWNFPLAIFTGQLSAALATGNAVLAKPAEQTSLIAYRAVQLLHEAGVPASALQLLPGAGDVGAALTSAPQVSGVAFTGSTDTAQIIHRSIAANLAPGTPLIAETGGLNAMIVDSTALPEQAVRAVVESAFQSAGQRCSALRCLYLQDDIAPHVIEMLEGAMDALVAGQPWELTTDIGPVIDAEAFNGIKAYIDAARARGDLIKETPMPGVGHFISPTMIRVKGIESLEREIFGPVLHVATFRADALDKVIHAINATGYGLTFGLQTRIDDRVEHVTKRIAAGNLYVNRNQIGAIVGSQPFGGEGLSGTGPKAGGPLYCERFRQHVAPGPVGSWDKTEVASRLTAAIDKAGEAPAPKTTDLPGPTGEANQYTTHARPPVLCLGPGHDCAAAQADAVRLLGGVAVCAQGKVTPEMLESLEGISSALWWGDEDSARAYRKSLANRSGPILTLITGAPDTGHARAEKHVCIDTTASGGNAALLGGNM
ncbi:bifunctional proline dehydrogenase/L-glutamate gamma-semialdehyde dehydrogenase PutA [Citreicella sp. C3M06]|uniref:bifunctional proline dehydrogenase/L-glutamate gamma-semialdehyde dehydrogenase PutA n=1 Tax=Citreicella sp. C3M06 TaxID=2841564 RepID=UPI001C0909C3|nr:bifunctional proline dehydrogenase/L-glutamate gamma-semialdehyde dehydrogenase PutA [Citreicella sp. C3M06]MBU2962496.1 bifunctional proline dehydrogenase/L-glutamate gamma-semialdehyde dehydrogenase PutA [Citreicella sp. C3M06]